MQNQVEDRNSSTSEINYTSAGKIIENECRHQESSQNMSISIDGEYLDINTHKRQAIIFSAEFEMF